MLRLMVSASAMEKGSGARADERLAGVALVAAFSIDNGLLTQTLKQRRDRISSRDAAAIAAIYGVG